MTLGDFKPRTDVMTSVFYKKKKKSWVYGVHNELRGSKKNA